MRGKLSTCPCVIELDTLTNTARYVTTCSDHARMEYTADETIAEHIAIQLDKIKYNPAKRIKRWWHT